MKKLEKASNEEEIVAEKDSKKEKRTQRKLSRKRAREEENGQEEYKEMLPSRARMNNVKK